MERQTAIDTFDIVASEAKAFLLAAVALRCMPSMCDASLEHARDRLHWACESLSRWEDDDIYVNRFLPLFDALAHVTDCLKRNLDVGNVVWVCMAMILNNRIAEPRPAGVQHG